MSTEGRGANGQFRRIAPTAEIEAKALRLHAQGHSYDAIAAQCGYASRSGAYQAVQRLLLQLAAEQGGAREARNALLSELDALKAQFWQVIEDPPQLTDRLGRPVVSSNGEPVPDVAAMAAAGALVLKAGERQAKLRGLDAPRVSVLASLPTMTAAQIRAVADKERQAPGATGLTGADVHAETQRVLAEAAALEAGNTAAPKVIEGRVSDTA